MANPLTLAAATLSPVVCRKDRLEKWLDIGEFS
jgi:hypothetical protein